MNGQIKLTAFYNSAQNAYKAVQIYCLTRVAMEEGAEESKYPRSVRHCMLVQEEKIVDEKASFNGIVLVTNLSQKTFFWDILT